MWIGIKDVCAGSSLLKPQKSRWRRRAKSQKQDCVDGPKVENKMSKEIREDGIVFWVSRKEVDTFSGVVYY